MTFTKEQLIAAAHGRIDFANMMLSDNPEPLKERTWAIELRLAEIALAALTVEPYGYVHQALHEDGVMVGLSTDHEAHSDSTTHVSVYRLPLLEGLE